MTLVIAALAAACGGTNESVRSAEELAEMLITPADLEGRWAEPTMGEGDEIVSGVVTEEQREYLPTLDLCDAASAESRATAQGLAPLAFRQLDLSVEDPIEPPADREGHLVFVQEFLFSAAPETTETTFDSLVAGLRACLGDFPADEEGPGRTEEYAIPAVGDDRYATLTTLEEAGGWAEWMIYNTFVREGAILMSFVIIDIRAGADPYFTDADIADLVRRAVDKW